MTPARILCPSCRGTKPTEEFASPTGETRATCQRCRDRDRRYRLTDRARELRAARDRRYRRRWPERIKARAAARRAVHRGLIVPPVRCDRCGRRPWREKHHPDHGQPLAVDFLCVACHLEEEGSMSRTKQIALGAVLALALFSTGCPQRHQVEVSEPQIILQEFKQTGNVVRLAK